jgi:CRISPR system Cascade subunit CasE
MSTDAGLHMARLRLETRSLFELAQRRKLKIHKMDVDLGYAVHCYLKELFGDRAPAPFAIVPFAGLSKERFLTVLGYCASGSNALEDRAKALADPAVYQGCDWSRFATKPLPAAWSVGARFKFEVRACPTVRKSKEGAHHRKGAEVDAFISRCWDVGDPTIPVCREAVYTEWLAAQIDRIGGARLIEVGVRAFERERMLRRTHDSKRDALPIEKPSAIFTGILEVTNPSQFARLMERGVGRHRAFGFGMILLRSEG